MDDMQSCNRDTKGRRIKMKNNQQECLRKVLSHYKKPEKFVVRFDVCLELCWRDEHHL